MTKYEDHPDGTMDIYEDGRFIETVSQPPLMAERQAAWRKETTKAEMLNVCKKSFADGFYKDCPELFESDLATVEEFSGDLSPADRLWIKNTRRQLNQEKKTAKVCSLANRLSADMDRKSAFKEAWRIVKVGGAKFSVSGVTFGRRQDALRRLARYEPKDIHAVLVPEPGNRFDPEAVSVRVLVQGSPAPYTLGYVPASQTQLAKVLLGRVPCLSIIGNDLLGARLSIAV
jgi:hypothetical protein